MKVRFDATDLKLLVALQQDGRLSYSELARRVGLSPPAVSERVRGLEESGVIRSYRADVDPAALGFPITVLIRIAVNSGDKCRSLLLSLEAFPEVLEAFRVTGEDSAVVKAVVATTDHLEDFINRLGRLGKPTTSIATSSFERGPTIPTVPTV